MQITYKKKFFLDFSAYFCRADPDKRIPVNIERKLSEEIEKALKRVEQNASSLLFNETTNTCEQLFSLLNKLVMSKRVMLSASYPARLNLTVISRNVQEPLVTAVRVNGQEPGNCQKKKKKLLLYS